MLLMKRRAFKKLNSFGVVDKSLEYGSLPEGMFERLIFELEKWKLMLKKSTYHDNGQEKVRNFQRI